MSDLEKTRPVPTLYGSLWLAGTLAALLAWPGLIRNFFVSDEFMPHGHCYLWVPALVRLHVVCDLLIGLSYVAISWALLYLVYRARKEIPFHWMFVAFGLFIVSCGATHFMEVWTIWHAHYWLSGGVKLLTAGASLATAVALPAVLPRVLEMISAARLAEERRVDLERVSAALARKNAELMAANKEMETFSYSIAHDLRAPLRAMDGFASIAAERYSEPLGEEGANLLAKIRRNAQRMNELIDALLSFSRLSRREMTTGPIDMGALVETAFKDVRALERGRAPALKLGTLPPAVGDPALIRQALINLLSNAAKFSAGAADPSIEVSGRVEDGHCVYTVKDHGAGFDMRYSDKLFKVFQRLHGAEFEGSGIGLANVARIIERHGGRVWAEGKVGQGASFSFSLPRA